MRDSFHSPWPAVSQAWKKAPFVRIEFSIVPLLSFFVFCALGLGEGPCWSFCMTDSLQGPVPPPSLNLYFACDNKNLSAGDAIWEYGFILQF